MPYFAPREAETTLPCPICQQKLSIRRSCQHVNMHCRSCKRDFPLNDYIARADQAMEQFLENVYCDRI